MEYIYAALILAVLTVAWRLAGALYWRRVIRLTDSPKALAALRDRFDARRLKSFNAFQRDRLRQLMRDCDARIEEVQ